MAYTVYKRSRAFSGKKSRGENCFFFGLGDGTTRVTLFWRSLMEYVQIQKRKFVRCFGFTNEMVVVIIQTRHENDSIQEPYGNI